MHHRFTVLSVMLAGLAAAAGLGVRADDTPALKPPAERKNFVEKLAGFQLDNNTQQKINLEARFEMVYVPGGGVTVGSPTWAMNSRTSRVEAAACAAAGSPGSRWP